MSHQNPSERALYFITHFLPWIGAVLALCGALICLYHRYNRSCMFEYLKEDEDEVKRKDSFTNSSIISYNLYDDDTV